MRYRPWINFSKEALYRAFYIEKNIIKKDPIFGFTKKVNGYISDSIGQAKDESKRLITWCLVPGLRQ